MFRWTVCGWELIGEVLIKTQKKKFYDGDELFQKWEYDFIFDVDGESGKPKQIQFNIDYTNEISEKYLAREKYIKLFLY